MTEPDRRSDVITLSRFRHGDVEFVPGDCVLVNAGDSREPFVGRILQIYDKPKSGISIRLVWLYRPKECPDGRQPYHGAKEVFQASKTQPSKLESVIFSRVISM